MSKRGKKSAAEGRRQPAAQNAATSKSRRGRRVLVLAVAALAILLALLVLTPTIVTRTFLRDYVIGKLLPTEVGLVSLTSLRAGWFSTLELQNLKIFDPQGKPLLEVEQLDLDRSLLGLAMNPSELGSLVATRPVLHLLLRSDGSNLEDALAKLQTGTAASSNNETPSPFSIEVKIVDATILAVEQASQAEWRMDDLSGRATVPEVSSGDWTMAVSGKLEGQKLHFELAAPLGTMNQQEPLGKNGKAKLQMDEVPLKPVQYLANRAGGQVSQLAGALSVSIEVSWKTTEVRSRPVVEATGYVLARDFQAVAPALLGPDELRIGHFKFAVQACLDEDVLTLTQCQLESDFGDAELQSTANISRWQPPTNLVKLLREGQFATSGNVDVAAITRAFPRVLNIRDDVQLASGHVTWNMKTEEKLDANTWTGTLSTSNVRVLKSGAPVPWQFPLELDFSVNVGAELELERLVARSDCFAFAAEGRLQSGRMSGQADLERLVFQLSEVLELDETAVRGRLQANVQWDEASPNSLRLDGQSRLTDFVVTRHDRVLCREDDLSIRTVGTATLDGQGIASVDSARLDVRSGVDSFVCQLQQPVDPDAVEDWPIDCWLRGEIADWIARLAPFGVSVAGHAKGSADVTAACRVNQRGSTIHSLVANIRDLSVLSDGMRINEPVVQIKTAGTINHATMSCRLPSATMASQTLSFAAKDLLVDFTPHFVASGKFGYRADVSRLMSYLPTQSTAHLTGGAVGQLELHTQDRITRFRVHHEFEDLQFVREDRSVWHEPQLTFECEGTYDSLEDRLDVAHSQLSGKLVSLAAAGSAARLSKDPVVELSGNFAYDLDGLLAIFGEVFGPEVRLSGRQEQRFSLNGPVFPDKASKHRVSTELVAQTGFGWNSATVYGLPLERGQLDLTLAKGVVQVSPHSLSIAGGRAQIAPAVYVNSELLWMTLTPGSVAEQIRITPEMSNSWMKYVAPLLAEATDAEGSFSVFLDRAAVPLLQPANGEVDGRLTIHRGAVRPGSLAIQLIELATQIKRLAGKGNSRVIDPGKTWIELGEQAVTFQLADGRVYHDGFDMFVDDVSIRTRGSVGVVDETISVIAEVAIPDEWLGDSRALAGLKGRAIEIPISGTLSRPSLDRRGLSQFANQLVQQATRGYVQEKLGSQLEKQLGGKLEGFLGEGPNGLGDKLEEGLEKQINRLFK